MSHQTADLTQPADKKHNQQTKNTTSIDVAQTAEIIHKQQK